MRRIICILLLCVLACQPASARHGRGSSASIGTAPGSPTFVQIIIQGGNKQGDNEVGVNAGNYSITHPTFQTIGWASPVGSVTGYYILMASVSTPGATPTYTQVATVSAMSCASNYSAYVTNTSGTNNSGMTVQPVSGINCAWQDISNCGATTVSGTLGPTSGYIYGPTTGCTYEIEAYNGSGISTASSPSILPMVTNGYPVFIDGIFNNIGQVTWSSIAPSTTPLGYTRAALVSLPAFPGAHYINPFTGSAGVQYNAGVMGFNYLVLSIYTAQTWAAGDFSYSTEIDGDRFLYISDSLVLPSAPTPNQWTTYKIPLFTGGVPFMECTDNKMGDPGCGYTYPSALNINQISYYKTTWSNNNASTTLNFYMEYYFSVD